MSNKTPILVSHQASEAAAKALAKEFNDKGGQAEYKKNRVVVYKLATSEVHFPRANFEQVQA